MLNPNTGLLQIQINVPPINGSRAWHRRTADPSRSGMNGIGGIGAEFAWSVGSGRVGVPAAEELLADCGACALLRGMVDSSSCPD
jgi:hypothetical protein